MPEKKYFAAANTSDGFVSYYDEVFGKCSRVYIIKGGSGTGKSYFMRQCAEYVKGLDTFRDIEYFYCSFDPSSLDGIIINGDVAIIDGTAPHVYEPTLAGAKENIVDLGRFWDPERLRDARDTLSRLFAKKKGCFSRAYGYLGACGELDRVRQKLISEHLDMEKLNAAVSKLVSEIECERDGEDRIRILSALGRDGATAFDTYERLAKRACKISDTDGAAHILLHAVISEARRFGMGVSVSYDPLFKNRPNAVLIGNTSIIAAADGRGENLMPELSLCSDRLSKHNELQSDLIAEAVKEFRRAAEIHFSIEEIYVSAMDFGRKEEFTEEFLKKLII